MAVKNRRSSKRKHAPASLVALEKLRRHFSGKAARQKLNYLASLRDQVIVDSDTLQAYHDLLCFIAAHPDDAKLKKAVEEELATFIHRVVEYKLKTRDKSAARLSKSGIDGTTVRYPFSLGVAQQLVEAFPHRVRLDWEYIDEESQDKLMEIVQLLLSWNENDALDNDEYLDAPGWTEFARSKAQSSDLEVIVDHFRESGLPSPLQQFLYDGLDLTVLWDLTDCPASRTLHRLPVSRVYYQKGPLRGRCRDLRKELKKATKPLESLSLAQGKKMVMAVNQSLAVRSRELFPITYGNPAEVYRYRPGRGVEIYIFGALPEIRLPLESNYGAMLVRNGVPIGYGVGAVLFDRVEIAINIFPAFRAGESAFIIEHFFKLFHDHFGSRLLLVRSRQMGDGDEEPIKAGSFWFYYKLGFRAAKQRIRNLAEEEFERISSHKGYRSSERMLRRLSKSDVFFHTDPSRMDSLEELSLMNLGYVPTRLAADEYGGSRTEMTVHSVRNICRTLGIRDLSRWSPDERVGMERLAPLFVSIPDLKHWPARDKKMLADCIRAKGATKERQFVLLCNRLGRLRNALNDMADKAGQNDEQ